MAEGAMRVFLDANILFSASFPESHLAAFLEELRRHSGLVTNTYATAEAERNIAAKFPKLLGGCQKFAKSLEVIPTGILCGAIAGEADFLLTGDRKDFGHLFGTTVGGVMIVSLRELVAELVARGLITAL
jgi:predicted nucleic acid-binding protein